MSLYARAQQHVNRVLALDPESLEHLQELSGQLVLLDFLNTDLKLYLVPGPQGFQFSSEHDEEPRVSIRATPGDMLAYLLNSRANTGNLTARLEISGDVALVQKLQSIIQGVDLDWEEQLASWFGDSLGHPLGRLFRGGTQLLRETHLKFQQDLSEYLRFEKNLTLENTEMEEFVNDIDILRDDVERLKQRIERLQRMETPE